MRRQIDKWNPVAKAMYDELGRLNEFWGTPVTMLEVFESLGLEMDKKNQHYFAEMKQLGLVKKCGLIMYKGFQRNTWWRL